MRESEFRDTLVRPLAELNGWKVYYTWNSIHSVKGYPDLTLVRGERIIFVELKAEKGRLTPEQEAWLEALRATGRAEVYTWKPSQWDEIVATLERRSLNGTRHPAVP